MKILNTPTKLDNNKEDWYYAVVDYETTSPGYGKDIKDTILSLQEIYECYLKLRDNDKRCYCGHTDSCDCSNPDITLFKESLDRGTISFELDNGWKKLKQIKNGK